MSKKDLSLSFNREKCGVEIHLMGLLSAEDLQFATETLQSAQAMLKTTHCSLLINATGLGLLDEKAQETLLALLKQSSDSPHCFATAFVYHETQYELLPSTIPLFQNRNDAALWLASKV